VDTVLIARDRTPVIADLARVNIGSIAIRRIRIGVTTTSKRKEI
tara:strand:+ start:72 stop:203 length:132 start_codon:yes stop_codon:yes gene_type:complete